jgi:hypothetical protein
MWHCPKCKVHNEMSQQFCQKCNKELQYYENVCGYHLEDMIVEVELSLLKKAEEEKSYWRCPYDKTQV